MRFQIHTARTLIREWQPTDWQPFRTIAADPQVMRYIADGSPWSDEQIQGFIARQRESAQEHGFCFGPLLDAASNVLIGQAGLQYLGTTGEVEIGWWLAPHCWGRGLGTEAAHAIRRFAFDDARLPRIVAIAHPQNLASIRIMQKIGMMFRGLVLRSKLGLSGKDMEIVLYSAERG
jgi:RimJ/RimL family protein N-acetyltransferase